ncbi:hypothetical protein AGLY_014987 [Aphis glycines]|uniref:Uncharacterized protein n=1 Tax=Aphis glycines TaxID=307491 RepID=A0A6G0T4V7_APHGL|nr:hypothetical protein AGLY_014987 [Aphis glycines]
MNRAVHKSQPGQSKHSKNTEPYFFESAYKVLPESYHEKLKLNDKGQIINLFPPINTKSPEIAWHCNSAFEYGLRKVQYITDKKSDCGSCSCRHYRYLVLLMNKQNNLYHHDWQVGSLTTFYVPSYSVASKNSRRNKYPIVSLGSEKGGLCFNDMNTLKLNHVQKMIVNFKLQIKLLIDQRSSNKRTILKMKSCKENANHRVFVVRFDHKRLAKATVLI